MTLVEKQRSIIFHMFGEWEFKKDNQYIHIRISEPFRLVQLNYNGKKSEFSSLGEWWGDFHFYFDNVHFVRYADDKSMIFGKNTSATIGINNDWEETFTRIK